MPPPMKKVIKRKLKVASACSGMCTEGFALSNLGVPHRLMIAAEKDAYMRLFIGNNHDPEIIVSDVTKQPFINNITSTPDLFVGGFPCQPFSVGGLKQGEDDEQGRGTIVYHLIKFIKQHRPKAFLLENVKGLVTYHPETFERILTALKGITDDKGNHIYTVVWRELNSKHYSVPQDTRLFNGRMRRRIEEDRGGGRGAGGAGERGCQDGGTHASPDLE
eukprot:9504150-Pyramimonas_sp.AAC.2